MIELCELLNKEPMTMTQLCDKTGLSKNKVYYHLCILVKKEYIEVVSDRYRNKLYAVTSKCPVLGVATRSHIHVYSNLKRPASDYAWQVKKHNSSVAMQSSMGLFD